MNILERRLEILKAEGMGMNRAETVKQISEQYNIPKDDLWRDYRTKPKWQNHFQGLDADKLRFTIHNRLEYCYRKASFLLLTTQNESVKLGALARMTEILSVHSQLLPQGAQPDLIKPGLKVELSYRMKLEEDTLKEYEEAVEKAVDETIQSRVNAKLNGEAKP